MTPNRIECLRLETESVLLGYDDLLALNRIHTVPIILQSRL